jgi:hypothetical protein
VVGVLGGGRSGSLAQPIDAGALSVQAGQHGERLNAEGVFDQGGVSQLRQPQLLVGASEGRSGSARSGRQGLPGHADGGVGQPGTPSSSSTLKVLRRPDTIR